MELSKPKKQTIIFCDIDEVLGKLHLGNLSRKFGTLVDLGDLDHGARDNKDIAKLVTSASESDNLYFYTDLPLYLFEEDSIVLSLVSMTTLRVYSLSNSVRIKDSVLDRSP